MHRRSFSGLVPHVAAWGKLQIDGALGVAGVLFGCGKYATATPKAIETHAPHGAVGQSAS